MMDLKELRYTQLTTETSTQPDKIIAPPFYCEGVKCEKCDNETVYYDAWESSDGAYEDYHYTCINCGYDYWVDGPDA